MAKLRLAGDKAANGATPVPANEIGETAALLLLFNDSDPLRLPVAEGVNVTLMVQLAPAAKVLPQALVCVKSPLAVMADIVSGPSPLFVRVTIWALLLEPTSWLENVRLAGDQDAVGVVPFPESVAEGAALVKSPDTVRTPLRVPCAVGAKVTVMMQFDPGATEVPQLFVWEKSPVTWILLRLIGTVPVLESVTVCETLVDPTTWLPNVRAVGESVPVSASAVPERLTEDGVAVKSPPIVREPTPD